MSIESKAQEESRHALGAKQRKLRELAGQFSRTPIENAAAEERLARVEKAHPKFAQADFLRSVGYLLLPLLLLVGYAVDYVLFGATAEYFAERNFNSPVMVHLARIVCPALVLLLDFALGIKRHAAQIERDRTGSSLGIFVWTAFGILFAFVMPALAIANSFVMLPAIEGKEGNGFLLQSAALALVAFFTHLLILFWGSAAAESKAFIFYSISRSWGKGLIRRSHSRHVRGISEFKDTFEQLIAERRIHEATYPDPPLGTLLFDSATRSLLIQHYPEGVAMPAAVLSARSNGSMGGNGNGIGPISSANLTQAENPHDEVAERKHIQAVHRFDQRSAGEWPE